MLKEYKTISGLYGSLEGAEVKEVYFEFQEVMLDLTKVISVYPDTYTSLISNWEEHNKRRDDEWRAENPNPEPCMHPPSMMTVSLGSSLPCVTIEVGTKLFHFAAPAFVIFDLVARELERS